jgi:superfamily I DNA/RNA helicase/Zn-dependent peptidase ImmA (M78 family)
MDAAELARQKAAQCNAEAVASGLDPFKLLTLALAEAERRDIDVEPSAPGGSYLGKSRATFRQAEQLIVYENVGTDFDKAFLIAHEIGHSDLGDDPEIHEEAKSDAARASEPCPTGIDRVVDYGRRQRREVQMDLFARELLLPRAFVRKLHLEQNLSASEIAERLGAPFDVVAQQLFDALLLPQVEIKEKTEGPERTPNEEQIEAAAHLGLAYLLEAGPGTGKTQTLTARVVGLLDRKVDPRRILLLTFSNKAAGEMAERIAKTNKDAAAAMWIGTFHAFGLDVIRRFHKELGLIKDPRMLDKTEAVELLEHEFPRIPLVHYRDLYDPTNNIADILSAISRAKDEVVDEKRYAELAQAMLKKATTDEERIAAEKAIEVAKVYETYEKLKNDQGCIDFGDLVCLPVRLLESNAQVRELLQKQYDHVLVDEYQDVNRSSVRLLFGLRGSGENLWVVGDAKQSIYRFRGASSFNMARFGVSDFVGGQRGWLKKNYRSVKEIVDLLSGFAAGMKVGKVKGVLESDRGGCGEKAQLLFVDYADQQTVVLADMIQAMRQTGHAYREQSVLCTGNEKLSDLAQQLERLGIPVLFLGSLFERTEVRDLLALVGTLCDGRATGLVRAACWPDFEMPMDDVSKVVQHFRQQDLPAGEWVKQATKVTGLSEKAIKSLQKFKVALDGFSDKSEPWEVLARVLLDRTRVAASIFRANAVKDRTRGIAIWQFMNFLRAQPLAKGLPIKRVMDRVRRLLLLGDDRDLRQLPAAAQSLDAVRLMTIHGSKGLEFPVVHLPNFSQSTIPSNPRAMACPPPDGMVDGAEGPSVNLLKIGHEEEQECLFYVAMSRARDRFFAYAPTKKSNGVKWGFSPYLPRLGNAIAQSAATPSGPLPAAPEEANVKLVVKGGLNFDGEQMVLYKKCPRRFFYTHLLQIGGRRTSTPFMQMHDAVRKVFEDVIEGKALLDNDSQISERIDAEFLAHGLSDHGYVKEYRDFAIPMLRYFASSRKGRTSEKPTALSIEFGNERIIVLPDDVLIDSSGKRTFRRVKTGHHSKSHLDDCDSAALLIATQQAFPDAIVELVYLSDRITQPISLTNRVLSNRREDLDGFLKSIRTGQFSAIPSAKTCPRCPAFFVCGATPQGVLQKDF